MANEFEKSQQYVSGSTVAEYLDTYLLARGWEVRATSQQEERTLCLGDRYIAKANRSYFIEYKSGIQTHYTGNVFIETISVDTDGKPGWLYTCKADFLLYACILDGCILVFKPDDLRSKAPMLVKRYPTRPTSNGQNVGYKTHGLLVPLADARSFAYRVWTVPN